MLRDRTNLFVSFRQSYTHTPYIPDTSNEPLIQDGFQAIEMTDLPPSWLDVSSKVDVALLQIQQEMAKLAQLHKKNALPGFDDRTAQEREIERLTFKITQSLHKCQAIAKQFEGMVVHESDAQRKMAANISIAMAQKIQQVSSMFRRMQSSYLKQLRSDANMGLPHLNEHPIDSNVDSDISLSQQTLEQVGPDTQNLQQREQEINRIAQGILEVADIFKDLQAMVIDQGTLLDRIDYNIETMAVEVKGADKELTRGSQYQKRTQKCKIILLLSLVVFGLVLVLLLKPRR